MPDPKRQGCPRRTPVLRTDTLSPGPPEQGAPFSLRGRDMPETNHAADKPSNSMVNILLVDDQPANLIALEGLLEGLGQNLIKAHSGEEALRHLLRTDFA